MSTTYEDERCAVLQDVEAALDYACRMVRELSANGCNDPGLLFVRQKRDARDSALGTFSGRLRLRLDSTALGIIL